MHEFLGQHPGIFMCSRKEVHFFCTDFHEESDKYHRRKLRFPVRSEEQYLEIFRGATDETIIGEATPDYLYSKAAARNIFEFNKNAKILILVRNPVALLRSLHMKLLTFGHETVMDFGEALKLEAVRRAGRSLPSGLFYPSSLYYSERIQFTEQIKRYREYFPESRVKVVVHDDFKHNNASVYEEVLRFLGVSSDFRPHFRAINPTRAPRFMFISRISAISGNFGLTRILPFSVRLRLRRKLRHLNEKAIERRPLDPDLHGTLMQKTRPEVERLSRLLGRDLLKLWDYEAVPSSAEFEGFRGRTKASQ